MTRSRRETVDTPTAGQLDAERAHRRAEGLALAAIEGNPLTADDIALLEDFDRLGLTDVERVEAIKALFAPTATLAAE